MKRTKKKRNPKTDVVLRMFGAAAGLFFFGFGVHLTIRANIGVGPWDALTLGLALGMHMPAQAATRTGTDTYRNLRSATQSPIRSTITFGMCCGWPTT